MKKKLTKILNNYWLKVAWRSLVVLGFIMMGFDVIYSDMRIAGKVVIPLILFGVLFDLVIEWIKGKDVKSAGNTSS